MKDNFLTLKDKKGNKKEYRILLDIESTVEKINYVIYTDESKNKNGEIKAYASTYELSPKGNMTKLKPVKSVEEFEFIQKILNSLEESEN